MKEMEKSFTCSPCELYHDNLTEFPHNMPVVLHFIHQINQVSGLVIGNYSMQHNAPVPHLEPNKKGTFTMPRSSYCCFLSTLICKPLLEKYYGEVMTDIRVVNGAFKGRGRGDHSWLEVTWNGLEYVIDTKPFDQGYPNLYNFGTPIKERRKKKSFKPGIIWFQHEEYKNRFDIAAYITDTLFHLELSPDGINKRRLRRFFKGIDKLLAIRKREYYLEHPDFPRKEAE